MESWQADSGLIDSMSNTAEVELRRIVLQQKKTIRKLEIELFNADSENKRLKGEGLLIMPTRRANG